MYYFDANASAQIRPVALQMLHEISVLGNPSSVHTAGRRAKSKLVKARESILKFALEEQINAELFFTSGGTEACNTIVRGFKPLRHVICSAIEHSAMLESVKELETNGCQVTFVPSEKNGQTDISKFISEIRQETDLVVMMTANNESGVIQPIVELATALRDNKYDGVIVSDYIQALGKSDLNVAQLFRAGVDAVAISGHKLGAPAGIGAVIINKEASSSCRQFQPLLFGGPQENRFRAGSENLLGAITWGAICDELFESTQQEKLRIRDLKNQFRDLLRSAIPDLLFLTPKDEKITLTNTILCAVPGCRGDDLVVALDLAGLCASFGSACHSGKQQTSYVVQAMGYDAEIARGAVRFSLDWNVTKSEIESGVSIISDVVQRMRGVTELEAA